MTTKTRNKQNPTNKTKIGEQKATKATIFRAQKLQKKEKKYLFCIFFHLKSLLKKIGVCLDSLIYYTIEVYPPPPPPPTKLPMENYFYTNPALFFSLARTFFICKNLFLFNIICVNLFLSIIICESIFLFVKSYFFSVCTYFYL